MVRHLPLALVSVIAAVGCGGSDSGAGGGGAGPGAAASTGSHAASTGSHASSTGSHASSTGAQGPTTTSSATGAQGGSTGTSAGGSGPGAGGSSGVGGAPAAGRWALGYYVGYDIDAYPIAQIDWTSITHIVFSPMTVKNDLSLDLSFSDQHGTGQADAKALSAAAHAHGVKALLMLGGSNSGANIATAAAAGNRAAFVAALLQAMDDLGYDGIDLDWEDHVNLDDLVALAKALRAARPGLLLTYPGGCVNGNFQTVDPRFLDLAGPLDQFNIQTYYPSTAFAGQGWDSWFSSPVTGVSGSTPIAIDDTLGRYAAIGIPKEKLGMGIAFYAICYTGGITGPRQPTDGTTQKIVGGDNNYPLSRFFTAGGTFDASTSGERKVDGSALVPYLTLDAATQDPGCSATARVRYITYDDETSIEAKGAFAKQNGYGGVIIWTLQEGWLPPGAAGGRAQNALMQALKHGFLDP